MASVMGADVCFFHWPEVVMSSDLKEILTVARAAGLDCGLTVDGPFQRLTATRNLIDVLQDIGRRPSDFQRRLANESEEVEEIFSFVEGLGIELILLCDDVAFTGGLYFSPAIFEQAIVPFYQKWVKRLASSKIASGWHSDGDVGLILSQLVGCGFRFFSLEPEGVDLLKFKRAHGSRVTLVTGIPADWFNRGTLDQDQEKECLQVMNALAREGGFILASSCGLHHPKFLPVLKQIYKLSERITGSPKT